jgi:hypothetical protein
MNMIHVSEKHQYDSSLNVIIYSDKTEKNYNDICVKIDIYEARTEGWFFDIAKQMVEHGMSPGDYIAIMVSLSYLEGVQQFREGSETPKGKAGEWFKKSAKRVFPKQIDDVIDRLWKEMRCGLFHAGFTNGKVHLSHDVAEAIKLEGDFIRINPKLFLDCVSDDLNNFISELRDQRNTRLRSNFEKLWNILWDRS